MAASKDPADKMVYAKGDCLLDEHVDGIAVCGVRLEDCLICSVLRETILSAGDRYRRITPDSLRAAIDEAKSGDTFQVPYLWQDHPLTFHLSQTVWAVEWDGMEFFAHRGLWRSPRQTWQEQTFEGGGAWLSGPAHPTLRQRIEKFVTGWRH